MPPLKSFTEPSSAAVRRRIAALDANGYTRLGAPIRHVTAALCRQQAASRLLLLLSDEPRLGVLECSRRLGVARGTVQARMDRLERRGVLRGMIEASSPARPCASPRSYPGLADGQHTFTVTGTDRWGSPDPSPPGRTWTVQRVADRDGDGGDGRSPAGTLAATFAQDLFLASVGPGIVCRQDRLDRLDHECTAAGEQNGALDCIRKVGEKPRHFLPALEGVPGG